MRSRSKPLWLLLATVPRLGRFDLVELDRHIVRDGIDRIPDDELADELAMVAFAILQRAALWAATWLVAYALLDLLVDGGAGLFWLALTIVLWPTCSGCAVAGTGIVLRRGWITPQHGLRTALRWSPLLGLVLAIAAGGVAAAGL